MPELVTAIVPTFNRAALLKRALDSIALQDYRPIEVVVVDDGSTDNTACIIPDERQKLAAVGIELIYRVQENGGPSKARNTGISLARGSLVSFLDSDDLWRPTFVSTLARLLGKSPSASVAFCAIDGIDIDDVVFARRPLKITNGATGGLLRKPFDFLIDHMALQTSGVMVRRSALDHVGVFDLSLQIGEDWDLWYRLAREYDFAYTTQALACNRHHADNIPKWDARALALGLVLNLKYLRVATEPASQEKLRERLEWNFNLLQEEWMRLGQPENQFADLLEHESAPDTMRFQLGRLMRQQPSGVGKAYAAVIRAFGRARGFVNRGETSV